MRKTPEELERIKKQYGVDTLWSFSKLNKYVTSPYEYYLKYILKVKEDRQDGIYAVSGGMVHSIIEKFYKKEISYEDMITQYEDALFTFEMAELKLLLTLAVVASTQLAVKVISILFGELSVYDTGTLA